MRPWIHIPLFVFLLSLLLASWVLVRRVPAERQGTAPVLAAPMEDPFTTGASAVLEGILVDAEGTPLPLADISTLQDGRILWTHSDEQGQFKLEDLQAGPLEVSVLAEGYLPETLAVAGPGTAVRIALTKPATPVPTLSEPSRTHWYGRIRNPLDPMDLAGFQIWLNPTGPPQEVASGVPRRALTDAEGRFEFQDLLHAKYAIHLLPPESEGGMGPDLLVPMGADSKILQHGDAQVTTELVSLAGRLEGTVLSGPESERTPISAAMIMITAQVQDASEGAPDQVLPAALTDRSGHWTVEHLQPGRYRIQVRGGGIDAETWVDLEAHQSWTVELPE